MDPFGVTCAGCLDFAFHVDVDQASQLAVATFVLSRFFGYTTDAGYVPQSGDAGPNSVPANTVSRGPFGGGITFNVVHDNVALLPGGATDFFVVATNAKTYDRGGSLIINSFSSTNINAQVNNLFEPTLLPEPSTLLLLAVGLGGIAAFRKRTPSQ